jgi:hypothetical protein
LLDTSANLYLEPILALALTGTRLFVSQPGQGISTSSSICRQAASQKCNQTESQANRRKCCGIRRTNPEKQVRQQRRQGQRKPEAGQTTSDHWKEVLTKNEPKNVPTPRAERHANTDFLDDCRRDSNFFIVSNRF